MSRSALTVAFAALFAAGLTLACSQASLPPGTPPPEYETRPVEPWPPASTLTAPPPAESPPVEPAAVPPPVDVPNDAGTPASPDAGADATPETGPF